MRPISSHLDMHYANSTPSEVGFLLSQGAETGAFGDHSLDLLPTLTVDEINYNVEKSLSSADCRVNLEHNLDIHGRLKFS